MPIWKSAAHRAISAGSFCGVWGQRVVKEDCVRRTNRHGATANLHSLDSEETVRSKRLQR